MGSVLVKLSQILHSKCIGSGQKSRVGDNLATVQQDEGVIRYNADNIVERVTRPTNIQGKLSLMKRTSALVDYSFDPLPSLC